MVIKMKTHKSPLLLPADLIKFVDAHRTGKSRNAFLVYIVKTYAGMVKDGIVTVPVFERPIT